MFRRIELISDFARPDGSRAVFKGGLMGPSSEPVIDAWISKLRGPNRYLPTNSRFYFTEKGWREVGRAVIEACGRSGQAYRVISIKETDAEVVWRDRHTGYEVAVQPKKDES